MIRLWLFYAATLGAATASERGSSLNPQAVDGGFIIAFDRAPSPGGSARTSTSVVQRLSPDRITDSTGLRAQQTRLDLLSEGRARQAAGNRNCA